MPQFFFISGYLYKPDTNYKIFIEKKVIHLLVPYFTFLMLLDYKVIIGFFYNLLNNSMNPDKYLMYKEHFLTMIYGGAKLTGDFGAFWFVN
jgi:fucose 4-O-acetylase-like acetyltransferase